MAHSNSVLFQLNPLRLGQNLWRHRDLICQFSRREIEGRYKGSFLGILWSLITPLVLLSTYTFVFGVVLKSRWPGASSDSLAEFALVIFCGLTAFNIFGECANRAAGLIVGVPNYVKKVVFPLEILPVSVLVSSLFHASVSLSILLLANLAVNQTFHWTLALLPLVSLPLIFLSLGLGWFLAGLGVFVRDLNYAIMLIVQVLFFLTPILYSLEAIPEPFQTAIRLNPLTTEVEAFRYVVLWGRIPSWPHLTSWLLINATLMLLGYAWFMRSKKAFADVI